VLSVFGRRIKGMIRLRPEQVWTCNKPVTLPRNQLLIRYAGTSLVHTVTIRGNVTSVYPPLALRRLLATELQISNCHGTLSTVLSASARFSSRTEPSQYKDQSRSSQLKCYFCPIVSKPSIFSTECCRIPGTSGELLMWKDRHDEDKSRVLQFLGEGD
jgi:hypothetical protein